MQPSPPPSQASSQSTTNAEIVVPPGVLLTWQLDYEGEGLGKILCLPLDSGVFTRDELAGCLQVSIPLLLSDPSLQVLLLPQNVLQCLIPLPPPSLSNPRLYSVNGGNTQMAMCEQGVASRMYSCTDLT